MVMPRSMVSLTVVGSHLYRWYSLFDGNSFLEIFRVLRFGMLRLIAQV